MKKFKRPDLGWIWYICEPLALFVLAFVVAWGFFRTPAWLVTSLNSASAAAWAQAVFSAVGIFIAILVPFKIHQGETRRDSTRGILQQHIADFRAAVALIPILSEVTNGAESIPHLVEQHASVSAPSEDLKKLILLPLFRRAADWMQRHSEGTSPALEANLLAVAAWASRLAALLESGMHDLQSTVTPLARYQFDAPQ